MKISLFNYSRVTSPARLLNELSGSETELTVHCVERFDAGGHVAEQEFRQLLTLAAAIGRDVQAWSALTGRLELARRMDKRRAGILVLESVFDELLTPVAWRVLADAFALVDL